MRKLLLSLLAPLIFLSACASRPPTQPLPVLCPAPPQLPALAKLPVEQTFPSFLDRMEKELNSSFQKPSEQTK